MTGLGSTQRSPLQNSSGMMAKGVETRPEYRLGYAKAVEGAYEIPKGVYKISKLGAALTTIPALIKGSFDAVPVAKRINASFRDLSGMISPMDSVVMLAYGVGIVDAKVNNKEHKGLKDSVYKKAKMFFHCWSKSAEGLMWLGKRGAIELGRLSTGIGGYNISSFKAHATILASTNSIVDSLVELGKEKVKAFEKHCLNLAEECGKIFLVTKRASHFTWTFTIVAILTAVAGLSKVVYDVRKADKHEWEHCIDDQSLLMRV